MSLTLYRSIFGVKCNNDDVNERVASTSALTLLSELAINEGEYHKVKELLTRLKMSGPRDMRDY